MNFWWTHFFRRLRQSLSVRAGLFCFGAILVALFAVIFAPYVPDDMAELLGGDAVDKILGVLASSMLAVVTFSLSTLIASYSVAQASAPSRATMMIMRDSNAQNALSTFLGAFIFSIISLVALSTGYYGPKGRVILFGVTLLVLLSVIWTIIRWIGHLSEMGQLPTVIARIEDSAESTITQQAHLFWSDETAPEIPEGVVSIECEITGFVEKVDLKRLSEILRKLSGEIWVVAYAGQYAYPRLILAKVRLVDADMKKIAEEIRDCFFIGIQRTFEDDPRFGLIVLSEVGSRALSPGINDPGSAIVVISSLLRMIAKMDKARTTKRERWWHENLHLRTIIAEEIVDDAFHAIARDGAQLVEVGIFLQKTLGAIARFEGFAEVAVRYSLIQLAASERSLKSAHDLERLKKSADWHADLK